MVVREFRPTGGDEREEYSEPEMRNAPAWEPHVWEIG